MEFVRIASAVFRQKRYRIIWKRSRSTSVCSQCQQKVQGNYDTGGCDPPGMPSKMMVIDPSLPEAELLETIIHEHLHACVWDLDERAVEDTARDIAKSLRRIGFKL